MLNSTDARGNELYRLFNSGESEQYKVLESCDKTPSTIVFIDSGVDDYQSLVNGVVPEAEVIVLDSRQDGVEQITKVLKEQAGIAAIHLVSHGSPGCLYLGNSQLSLDTLSHYATQLKTWIPSASVNQGGKSAAILLYGCNVAAGDAGEEFVTRLGQLTGANIAASAKRTGSAMLEGDWNLEVTTNPMQVSLAFSEEVKDRYASVLVTFAVTNTNDDGNGSLRNAIDLANTTAGADTIIFEGAVFTDSTPDTINLASGELFIDDSLTIEGLGAENLTISGNGSSRVFTILENTNTTITGLTISGGNTGIGGDGILDSETIDGNGGGIAIDRGATLELRNSVVAENSAFLNGGGIFSSPNSTLRVFGSTIRDNFTENGNGGGIASTRDAELLVSASTISGNLAQGSVRREGNGGGLFLDIDAPSTFSKQIVNSTISNNSARHGAGIFLDEGRGILEVESSTITQNRGGGITSFAGPRIAIIDDRSDPLDSDQFFNEALDPQLRLKNSIVVDNLGASSGSADIFGFGPTLLTSSFSLIGDQGFPPRQSALLGPLQDNGGPTFTHLPLPGSPAIDAGAPNSFFRFDQRGVRRPQGASLLPDIGAVEVEMVVPPVDIEVTNIEVTQGIQTPDNTVPLVAERSTAVRVTVEAGSSSSPMQVSGRLHIFADGREITPRVGLISINSPIVGLGAPQRNNETDTLNFEISDNIRIPVSSDVDFRVDISPAPTMGNPFAEVNDLEFVAPISPKIFFTSINYTPSGLGLPDFDLIKPGVGDAFVKGIFPVNDNDPNLYKLAPSPSLQYSEDNDIFDAAGNNINQKGILEDPDVNGLLALLAAQRQLIVDNKLGANSNTFLYGWLAGNPIDGNGWASGSNPVAFGNTDPTRHQRTFAHELGHLFGVDHPTNMMGVEILLPIDQVGWDVRARLDGNPSSNNTTGHVKPTTLNDIMVGGLLTNQAWVDTITYQSLLNSGVMAGASGPDQGDLRERVFVIQGIFDPEGQELLELNTFRFPWLSQADSLQQEGQFMAEVVDEAGNVTQIRFDAFIESDSANSEEEFGFFEVMVPVSSDLEVASLRITDISGNQEFGSLQQSAAPQISIVEPLTGAFLGEETQVVWDAFDPDTPAEELQFQLAYSPDNGNNFVPIAVNVPGTENSITFNSTEIQNSLGSQGLIRVFVSDGLNTAFADVLNLTPLDAQFAPPSPLEITVDTLEDIDDNDLSVGGVSLREALALISEGGTINFDSSLAGGTIDLTLGELVIDKDLTINGLGADKLTISGNNTSRIFNIDDGNAFNSLDVKIRGLTIADGNADFGGGIFNEEQLLISSSTIRDNTAQFSGGGIFSDGRLNIKSSTISGNTAERSAGGGISGSDFLSINNVTISGNQAGNNGGGISFGQGSGGDTLIVNSSTITQNTTNGNGGGIFSNLANSNDDLIAINNSIIAQNFDNDSSDGNSPDVWGEFSSNNRFNLIGDLGDNTSNGDFLTAEGNQVGTSANPINPMLGDLQDNGGPTFTHAPLPGSPVLDAANPLAGVIIDQRGISRPQGEGFDIGAVEGSLNPSSVGTRDSDRIVGDSGNNVINGGRGADVIFGGAGNDILRGAGGDDILKGEDGNDRLMGHGGNNSLFGGNDNDTLWGGQRDDLLDGGAGSDRLFGQNGNDTLLGGHDLDLLEGGRGNDLMTGGEGNDIFQLRQSDFMGGTFVDQILDFNAAEDDRLRLVDISMDEVMFNKIGTSDLELTFTFGGKVTFVGVTDAIFVASNVDFDATRLGNNSPLPVS
ncbi:MAG: DUF4347 domain-containing protein [Symploca sp. SIO1C2]|nr:DUF4347 domain-containing protein [Symploca sp. SIO1C2]